MDRSTDFTQYVLPLVGTENGGNMFPGATTPFGMVRLGPDFVKQGQDAYAGYLSDKDALINGFSMTHLSGVGGIPMYGVVSQLPVVGDVENLFSQTVSRVGQDVASVGYYRVRTAQEVEVELAATQHAGIYRYRTQMNGPFHVVLDLSHALPTWRDGRLEQRIEGAKLWTSLIVEGRYRGSLTFSNGYNLAAPWTIHFCVESNPPPSEVRLATGDPTSDSGGPEASDTIISPDDGGDKFFESSEKRLALDLVYKTSKASRLAIESRVGISYMSTDQACQNLENEMPKNKTFEDVVAQAKDEWNSKVLSKVTTTETSPEELQNLYTSLYAMHQMPTNRTGENPLWKSKEPYWDDIYTFWDLFRSWTPLMHILQPEAYDELLRSIVDVYQHEGYLPDARSVNFNGPVQGGSNADNVLADAYVKGAGKDLNWKRAWEAMVKNAEIEPPNNHDPRALDSSTKEGRGGLSEWIGRGFLTTKYSRSVSRGVEYSVNDFSLAQVAAELDDVETFQKYMNRSTNWKNNWDPESTSNGFKGFLSPRNETGFVPHRADECCGYWADPFYQGSPWEYGFNVHHDMARLIELSGGNKAFHDRLERSFQKGIEGDNPDRTIYNPKNQVSFGLPYLFHYIGRPERSVAVSRQVFRENFKPTPRGIPGAADAGALQSQLLWNMIGLYPITGQTTFLIHSPWFEHLRIDLGASKALVINATGIRDKDTDMHVLSLKVNGREWRQSWLTWSDIFAEGGTMEFELGTEADFQTRGPWFDANLVPPSPASKPNPLPSSTHRQGGTGGASTGKTHLSPYFAILFLLVPVLLAIAWLFWRRRTKRKQQAQKRGWINKDQEAGAAKSVAGGLLRSHPSLVPPPLVIPSRPPVPPRPSPEDGLLGLGISPPRSKHVGPAWGERGETSGGEGRGRGLTEPVPSEGEDAPMMFI